MTPKNLPNLGRVHFLGMAGVGVSAVARIMAAQGYIISGTDAKDLPVMQEFADQGARTFIGYDAQNLETLEKAGELPDVIVASSIAQDGNPEYEAARSKGLRLLHRSEALAETMQDHTVIAVAGTHGKTTTSSMTATALRAADTDPTFAIGANLMDLGVNAHAGNGDLYVAEADESDGSLLNYTPDVVVLTNVEPDHLDHYGSEEAVYQVFRDFVDRIKPQGSLIYCVDDPGAQQTAQWASQNRPDVIQLGYGYSESAKVRLADEQPTETGQQFTLTLGEESYAIQLQMPGRHNALNAAAAIAAASTVNVDLLAAITGLKTFGGAARRFQLHGNISGVRVFDDYAHHPTEVEAVLNAARSIAQNGKVRVLFQPHLFSRTREFAAEFAEALSLADDVRLLEIYPAREEPIPGVASELISEAMSAPAPIVDAHTAAKELADAAREGDVILTIGAGDVTYQAPQIIQALKARTETENGQQH